MIHLKAKHNSISAILGCSAALLGSASAQLLLDENFDINDGGFVQEATGNSPIPAVYSAASGAWSIEGDDTGPSTNTLTSPAIAVSSTAGIQVSFDHRYSIEGDDWDGGGLQISVDGGDFENVPGSAFTQNGYTNINPLIGNHVLRGLDGFSTDSAGYYDPAFITSVANVGGVAAGSSIQVRFVGAFDEGSRGAGIPNWEIDSITVETLPDSDDDGMPDDYEDANGLNSGDPSDAAGDADSDNVTNLDEYLQGTDPRDDDSDDDGAKDGVESNSGTYVDATDTGTDPLNSDTDGDGLLDGAEDPALPFVDKDQTGTNPLVLDSDGDGFDDGLEVLVGTSNPTNPASRPLRSGLLDILAYWDFNDNSDPAATYDLVKGFKGDLKAGTLFSDDATGRTLSAGDRALDMGPTGGAGTGVIVEQGSFLSLAGSQDQIGISFWINMPDFQNSMAVYANSPAVERAFSAHAPWSNGQAYWDTNGCCDGARQRMNIGADFTVNTWNHVVLNKNGDTKAIWVNGVKLLEKENTDDLQQTFTRFFIGTDSAMLNTVGLMDDMAVYADALSDDEIAALAGGDDPLSIVPANDDADLDNMPDAYEIANGLNPAIDDSADDLDNDGSSNISEFIAGTNPNNEDSDEDGLKDGVESNSGTYVDATDTGTDPLNSDTDGDGLLDGAENPGLPFVDKDQAGTDPTKEDSDGDGYADLLEIDNGSDPTDTDSTPGSEELTLLTYFNFDGQLADQVGNTPDAVLGGSAVLTTTGMGTTGSPGDEALELGAVNDGAYAQTAAGPHLDLAAINNAMSVTFWQFRTSDGSTSSFWIHSPDADGNQRGFQAHVPWGNGTIYFDQSGCCDGPERLTTTGSNLDVWQHFVFQRNEFGDRQIWIDGVLAVSAGDADPLDAFDGIITLGAEGPSLANSFGGRIDDFAIFANALSPEQIMELAAGANPPDLISPPVPFIITEITHEVPTGKTTITWNSRTNRLYAVDASDDLSNWEELTDSVASTGEATSYNAFPTIGTPRRFYRVREVE